MLAATLSQATTERDAPWQLTGVSKDQMTLHLQYAGGGCSREDGRAILQQSSKRVRIRVRQTVDVPPSPTAPDRAPHAVTGAS